MRQAVRHTEGMEKVAALVQGARGRQVHHQDCLRRDVLQGQENLDSIKEEPANACLGAGNNGPRSNIALSQLRRILTDCAIRQFVVRLKAGI